MLFVAIGALFAALALVLGMGAAPAGAHATLQSTTPGDDELIEAVPDVVEMTFDEPVEVADDGIEVIGPQGGRADDGDPELSEGGRLVRVPLAGDEQGTYTVAWRVLSEDGHNITGSFIFHVGERTGAADLDDDGDALAGFAGWLGRFISFAATVAIVGAVAVTVLAQYDDAAERRTRRLVVVAGAVGVVGVALVLVAQAADTTGRSLPAAVGETWGFIRDTRTGPLIAWRGVALAGALVVALADTLIRPVRRRVPWPPRAGVAVAAAIVCQSLAGHAWTADSRAVAVVSDVVHLSAVGVWVGGLLALALTLPVVDDRARLARRFSAVALGAVVVVAVTGTVSAVVEMDTWSTLVDTAYGQLLLVKLAGFVMLVGIGWLNRTRLLPAIERMSAQLASSVRVEVGIAGVMLAVTALMVNQPPAGSEADGGADAFDEVVAAPENGAQLQLQVVPAVVGINDIHLYFYEPDGATPLSVDAAQLTVATGDVPPRRLDLLPATPSHMSALGATFGSAGTWTLEVIATSAGIPMTFTAEVPIA